jgi:hypothetical protein
MRRRCPLFSCALEIRREVKDTGLTTPDMYSKGMLALIFKQISSNAHAIYENKF